jgi:deoxyribonuclease-1
MTINIAALWQKGKNSLLNAHQSQDLLLVSIFISSALGAFACGRLSIIEAYTKPVGIVPITLNGGPKCDGRGLTQIQSGGDRPSQSSSQDAGSTKNIVASKNGTKYHLVNCSGAKSIKEENKIWFASEADAQAAGYTRAGNCK